MCVCVRVRPGGKAVRGGWETHSGQQTLQAAVQPRGQQRAHGVCAVQLRGLVEHAAQQRARGAGQRGRLLRGHCQRRRGSAHARLLRAVALRKERLKHGRHGVLGGRAQQQREPRQQGGGVRSSHGARAPRNVKNA